VKTKSRAKQLYWKPSYVDLDAMYPPSASAGIHFDDWDAWDDPFNISYRQYIDVQAKKEVGFHPVREAFERYNGDQHVPARWYDGMKLAFPILQTAEVAAGRAHARTARYAPAPALRAAAFYQSIDEMRHFQNHLYEMRTYNQADEGFDNWAFWRDNHFAMRSGKYIYEDIMNCDNVFEVIIALNLCVEVVFTNLIFVGIPSVGALNGDTAMAQEMLTTQSDETRHMAIGQSTLRTLLRDERNVEQLQYWLDKWFWLQHRAIAGPVGTIPDYFAKRKYIPYQQMYQRYVIDNFIAGMVDDLAEFGLKPPRFLEHAKAELPDYSHTLYRTLFQYKNVLFNKMFVPTDDDLEFFTAGYPTFEANHGKFWDEVRAGDPKDLPQLPMLCQMCGLPCVFPVPERPTVCCSMYDNQAFWFCSEGCKWIFDHEPFRYSHRVTMERQLNGLDVPEIRAVMGLPDRNIGGQLKAEDEV
jgi:phenol hydroxylase P3 protein